jgi:D-alanine-D-alanine ligase
VKINPDWWKILFDEIYLITDARSVCDDELTSREVDMVEARLGLQKSWPIVDLCGGHGRHALELSSRGFQDVTVVDYSGFLIDHGRESAQSKRLATKFVKKDARATGLPSAAFRAAIVMANSFGYFVNAHDDSRFLLEAHRLLTPGGQLLLDLTCKDYITENFKPISWHEADGEIVICREREMEQDMVYSREIVLSKTDGLIRDETYCVRLYSRERITDLLTKLGFSFIKIENNYASHRTNGDYGHLNNRMIVTASKPNF